IHGHRDGTRRDIRAGGDCQIAPTAQIERARAKKLTRIEFRVQRGEPGGQSLGPKVSGGDVEAAWRLSRATGTRERTIEGEPAGRARGHARRGGAGGEDIDPPA